MQRGTVSGLGWRQLPDRPWPQGHGQLAPRSLAQHPLPPTSKVSSQYRVAHVSREMLKALCDDRKSEVGRTGRSWDWYLKSDGFGFQKDDEKK